MSEAFTPGPWMWEVRDDGRVSLVHPNRGHLIVMDFVRRGMNGGTCRFAVWDGPERGRMGGIMHKPDEIDIENHPDARLIAAAPDLLEACKAARIELMWLIQQVKATPGGSVDKAWQKCKAAITKATGEEFK